MCLLSPRILTMSLRSRLARLRTSAQCRWTWLFLMYVSSALIITAIYTGNQTHAPKTVNRSFHYSTRRSDWRGHPTATQGQQNLSATYGLSRTALFGLVASIAIVAFSIQQFSTKPIQNSTQAEEKLLTDSTSNRQSQHQLQETINDTKLPMRTRMSAYVQSLQSEIVDGLSQLDPGSSFRRDHWERSSGGSGTSCILQEGSVFEKAGVNVSIVHGTLPPAAVQQMRNRLDEDRFGWWDGKQHLPFFACGISLVVHPVNPMAPTVHLNYRYFEIEDPSENQKSDDPKVWWFGGGTDLTPSYLFEEDAQHFHRQLKTKCDKHNKRFYPDFKEWCDRYFLIPHRGERRGIGGIFFDDLTGNSNQLFSFVRDLGNSFLPTYLPIIERRQWMRYSDHQKRWQQLRRGRYVEFNLVYDRGTKFGLATPGARIESILMSLPLTSRWEYMPEIGNQTDSEENKLLQVLKEPKDWI